MAQAEKQDSCHRDACQHYQGRQKGGPDLFPLRFVDHNGLLEQIVLFERFFMLAG